MQQQQNIRIFQLCALRVHWTRSEKLRIGAFGSFFDVLAETKANRNGENILLTFVLFTCVRIMEKLLQSIIWIYGALTLSSQGQP